MSRPDDITGLLQKGPDPTSFRQGRLLTFSATTGANTVLVQGGTLTNLPLLIEGGAFNLQGDDALGAGNGNVVIIMKMRSSWAILGRVLTQGDPNIINSADITQGLRLSTTNFPIPTVTAAPITITSLVPSWANKAIVQSGWTTSAFSSVATQYQSEIITLGSSPAFGVGSTFPVSNIAAGTVVTQTVVDSVPVTVNPGSTLTIQGAVRGLTAIPADPNNTAFLVVTVTFQKI